jgi:hypothetical protein
MKEKILIPIKEKETINCNRKVMNFSQINKKKNQKKEIK